MGHKTGAKPPGKKRVGGRRCSPAPQGSKGKPTASTHAKKAYKPALSDDDLDRRATHTGDDDGGGDGARGRAVESLDRGEQTTVEADKLHLLAAVETRDGDDATLAGNLRIALGQLVDAGQLIGRPGEDLAIDGAELLLVVVVVLLGHVEGAAVGRAAADGVVGHVAVEIERRERRAIGEAALVELSDGRGELHGLQHAALLKAMGANSGDGIGNLDAGEAATIEAVVADGCDGGGNLHLHEAQAAREALGGQRLDGGGKMDLGKVGAVHEADTAHGSDAGGHVDALEAGAGGEAAHGQLLEAVGEIDLGDGLTVHEAAGAERGDGGGDLDALQVDAAEEALLAKGRDGIVGAVLGRDGLGHDDVARIGVVLVAHEGCRMGAGVDLVTEAIDDLRADLSKGMAGRQQQGCRQQKRLASHISHTLKKLIW